jgi:hypothetical protein
MSLYVNNSMTATISSSLHKNLAGARNESIRAATGKRILNSYEDPSSYVLANKLINDSEILKLNAQGAVQTAAMLAQANTRIADLKHQALGIKSNLLQGYHMFVSDEVRNNNLQPIHDEFVKELSRLVTEFNFAGQKLFSGQAGDQNVPAIPSQIQHSWNNLDRGTISLENATIASSNNSNFTISNIPSNLEVNGGVRAQNANGEIVISGATITLNNVDAIDINGAAINNITLELKGCNIVLSNDGQTAISINVNEVSELGSTNGSFTGLNLELATNKVTLDNVTSTKSLSGGQKGYSSMYLITGVDLHKDKVDVILPNLQLADLLQTIEIEGFLGNTVPTNFTNITDRASVQYNMQLIDGYLNRMNEVEGQLASMSVKLENIIDSSATSITALGTSIDVINATNISETLTDKAIKEFNAHMGMQMFRDQLSMINNLKNLVN